MKRRKSQVQYKEHPRARRAIERWGYYPHIYVCDGSFIWDGYSLVVTHPEQGRTVGFCRGVLQKQLHKMILEHYWPELKRVRINVRDYNHMKDAIDENQCWQAMPGMAGHDWTRVIEATGLHEWQPQASAQMEGE